MGTKKNLTIYDIAKLSGFSPKTVSRVINNEDNVKESTYKKIKKVMDENNYLPNVYAQNLVKKKSWNILITVKKAEVYPLKWFDILLESLIIEAKKNNINVIIEYFEEGLSLSDSILEESSGFIDGAILFYEIENDPRIDFFKRRNIPFVIFGKSNTEKVIYISNNDFGAVYNLMEFLFEHKMYNNLLLIGNKSLVNLERVKGAIAAYEKYGINLSLLEVVYDLETIEDINKYAEKHINKMDLPDSIFVSGDEKVIGLYHDLNRKKIIVPSEVSVIGFDNIPISGYYSPSLTTIAQDYCLLSEKIIEILLKQLNKEIFVKKNIEIDTKLIIRESVKLE